MGVTGLWRLIEPSGKPVPLETLENKTLAVDVSIWLHQAIKGFQDSQGAAVPNAHLLGIYHRVCKLLYFRVKPIFVFDGGVPNLKKETIAKRNQLRSKKLTEAESIQKQLLATLLKHTAVNKVLSESLVASVIPPRLPSKEKADNIYQLPPKELSTISSSDEDSSSESAYTTSPTKHWDLHTIDEKSPRFKALPADVRHEILTELKETRKQSSWGRLHEIPKKSDDFSSFQMKRLLKRYSVQTSLEEVEKEMGGRSMSLAELESILKDQGVVASDSVGNRIASNEHTKYLLIKDIKKAIDDARNNEKQTTSQDEDCDDQKKNSKLEVIVEEPTQVNATQIDDDKATSDNSDVEFKYDLEKAIRLSLRDMPSTSKNSSSFSGSDSEFNLSTLLNDSAHCAPASNTKNVGNKNFSSAKSYMVEYSGLTPNEISKIIGETSVPAEKYVSGNSKLYSASSSTTNTGSISKSSDENVANKQNIESNESTYVNQPKVCDESNLEVVDSTEVTTVSPVAVNPKTDDGVLNNNKATRDENVTRTISEDVASSKQNKNNEKIVAEDTDVVSNADSSSTEDFLEVEECELQVKPSTSGLEITVKPGTVIEDDIFKDIFDDSNKKRNSEQPTSLCKTQSDVIKEDNKSVDFDKPKEAPSKSNNNEISVTIEKVSVESQGKKAELTRKEETKDVIRDLLKPLPNTENSNAKSENKTVTVSTEQLVEIEKNLQEEKVELLSEKLNIERKTNNPTEQIYQEAQELLQLFGVPYIIAPMEAEAQCAFLNNINMTDGTITDDSDVWLFGGKTVYKNFFNQQKLVMEFRSENILHHFKLGREQMILLALLVGSDYTTGIQGIGPVTALEVLAAFPPSNVQNIECELLTGLSEFRKWIVGGKTVGPGRTALRSKLKNVAVPDSFPSSKVVKAYLEPTVDTSTDPFSWSQPDIEGLIEFAKQKFGWAPVKSKEILKPVLKRQNESRIQRSIKDYFQTKHKIDGDSAENMMSKRVKRAVNQIGNKEGENSEESKVKSKTANKRPRKKKKEIVHATEGDDEATTSAAPTEDRTGLSSDEDIQILKQTRVNSKKKLVQLQNDIKKTMEQQQQTKKTQVNINLHKKDTIPQKEQDKIDAVRSKLKAIEVFRKSKRGPGYVKKGKTSKRQPKDDAELSESSTD